VREFYLICGLVLFTYGNPLQAQPPTWPTPAEHAARVEAEKQNNAEQAPAATPAIEQEAKEAMFVVQLGAFQEQASAQRAARAIGQPGLRVQATQRNGQDWYVLLLGSYKSREDAEKASASYLQAHPNGSTWVRSTADLQQ